MHQPNFFEPQSKASAIAAEQIVLYALGDFQARGKALAQRELPLDRLRGALRRATETFGVDELTDEQIAATLDTLGANVRRVPTFVAKHPYRVTVQTELAEHALQVYRESAAATLKQNE